MQEPVEAIKIVENDMNARTDTFNTMQRALTHLQQFTFYILIFEPAVSQFMHEVRFFWHPLKIHQSI